MRDLLMTQLNPADKVLELVLLSELALTLEEDGQGRSDGRGIV